MLFLSLLLPLVVIVCSFYFVTMVTTNITEETKLIIISRHLGKSSTPL